MHKLLFQITLSGYFIIIIALQLANLVNFALKFDLFYQELLNNFFNISVIILFTIQLRNIKAVDQTEYFV